MSSIKSTSDEEMSVEKVMCLIVCYTLIIADGDGDATGSVPLCQLVRRDNLLALYIAGRPHPSTPNVDPFATSFYLLWILGP
tara:strand:- start:137 stop:382 length:246 start_codon:yes stop_codon:yes gene_type:complete